MPSVILIQILAFVTMMRSLGNPIGSLLLAKGRADLGFYLNCMIPFILFPAIYAGAKLGGMVGVAWRLYSRHWSFFGWYIFSSFAVCWVPVCGLILPHSARGLTAGLMALAVAGLPQVLALDGFWLLAVQVTVGALLYVALNWLLYRERGTAILRLAFGRDD